MYVFTLSHVLGCGQLLVLDETHVLLVLVNIIEIALCVIVWSEINDGDIKSVINLEQLLQDYDDNLFTNATDRNHPIIYY